MPRFSRSRETAHCSNATCTSMTIAHRKQWIDIALEHLITSFEPPTKEEGFLGVKIVQK